MKTAWPALVGEGPVGIVRSQPIARVWYWPGDVERSFAVLRVTGALGTRGTVRPSLEIHVRSAFIFMHEMAHLWLLSWTPAKELAVVLTAFAYDELTHLSRHTIRDSAVADHAAALNRVEARIRGIFDQLVLAEELLCTAIAYVAIADDSSAGGRWEDFVSFLEPFLASALDAEESRLPGFKALFDAALRVSRHLRGSSEVAARLVPLLQPITDRAPALAIDAVTALVGI